MSTFPTAIPSYLGFTASHTLLADTHAAQHNQEQADIIALATKVGTGSSVPASGLVLAASGAGTSSWSQVNLTTMVSGVLPVANGGTGTTSTTGSGSVVFATSPTLTTPILTTPTIADLTNSQHNHSGAAGGGQIANSGISGVGAEKFSNPYKFSVYRNAAQNVGTAAFVLLACDTKLFDTGSNVDVVTNKGRFTAPIAGFYQFNALVQASLSGTGQFAIALFKNGVQFDNGTALSTTAMANTIPTAITLSSLVQLAANDYVEIFVYGNSGFALSSSSALINYFQGFLVSVT